MVIFYREAGVIRVLTHRPYCSGRRGVEFPGLVCRGPHSQRRVEQVAWSYLAQVWPVLMAQPFARRAVRARLFSECELCYYYWRYPPDDAPCDARSRRRG